MGIRRLDNSDEEKLEQFLSGYGETTMFLRSNMRQVGLEYQDTYYHGEYFGAFDETGQVTGVLVHNWNGCIMMQAQDHLILSALVNAFRQAVTRPITGVLGADEQAKAIIDDLSLFDETFETNRAEGLYALDLSALTMPAGFDFSKAEMIDASKVDRATLIHWLKAYNIEGLGKEDNEALGQHVEEGMEKATDRWALLIDDKPVSLSGFNAKLPEIVQVGPVWTPPKYRNRGYARALVAMTLQKARQEGARKAILFTDTPAAIKAYEAIGFEKIGTYRLALLKQPIDIKQRPR